MAASNLDSRYILCLCCTLYFGYYKKWLSVILTAGTFNASAVLHTLDHIKKWLPVISTAGTFYASAVLHSMTTAGISAYAKMIFHILSIVSL